MKLTLKAIRLLLIAMVLLFSKSALSTHLIGGDLQVELISAGTESSTFLITLKVFRDCTPGTYDLVEPRGLELYDAVTDEYVHYYNLDYHLVSQEILTLGDECFSPEVCVEQYIFQREVEIDNNPNGYYLIWSTCCRNVIIENLNDPFNDGMTYYVEFPDPAIPGGNSTPHFGPYPTYGYLCVNNQNQLIDFNISDPDGDSLSFSLVDCLDSNNDGKPFVYCNWAAGYSANNVFGNTFPFNMTINQYTGVITCYPTQVGVYVFSVLVEEFRNGVKIGEAVRDVQYQVLDCPEETSPLTVEFESPNDSDSIVEGCLPGKVIISRVDSTLDLTVDLMVYGTAWYGVDFNQFPQTVVIPAGNSSVEVPIVTIQDNLAEGMEYVIFFAEAQDLSCIKYESSSIEFFIKDYYQLELEPTGDTIVCTGDTAVLSVDISQGEPDYGITWEFGQHDTLVTFTPFEEGYYQVAVADAYGCITVDSAHVEITGEIETNAGLDTIICFGDQVQLGGDGLNPTGPVGATYNWQPPLLDSAGAENPTTQIWETTEFAVQVTSLDGCTETDYVRVEVYHMDVALADTSICPGEPVQLNSSGSESVSYAWVPSDGLSSDTVAAPIATPNQNTVYVLTTQNTAGCSASDSIFIGVHALNDLQLSVEQQAFGCDGQKVEASANTVSHSNYQWIIAGDTIGSSTIINGVIPYGGGGEVQLIEVDSNGCKHSEQIQIPLEGLDEYLEVEIPNVFTPNNDGKNDVFTVEMNGEFTSCLEMKIFNRWGNLLFESYGHVINWDGYATSGEQVPAGTYFYLLKVGETAFSGNLMLSR